MKNFRLMLASLFFTMTLAEVAYASCTHFKDIFGLTHTYGFTDNTGSTGYLAGPSKAICDAQRIKLQKSLGKKFRACYLIKELNYKKKTNQKIWRLFAGSGQFSITPLTPMAHYKYRTFNNYRGHSKTWKLGHCPAPAKVTRSTACSGWLCLKRFRRMP